MAKSFHDKQFCSWCGDCLKKVSKQERRCEGCKTSEWCNPKPSVAVLIFNSGELLLGRRARAPGKGKLDLPGGFIDYGESAEAAAVRELKEELGLRVNRTRLTIVGTCSNTYLFQNKAVPTLDIYFRLDLPDRPDIKPDDDVASAGWQKPKNINFKEFWSPKLADALRSYLQKENML